jgi:hypothetical protein
VSLLRGGLCSEPDAGVVAAGVAISAITERGVSGNGEDGDGKVSL